MKTLLIPEALKDAGVMVRTIEGWDTPVSRWAGPLSGPGAAMWHHTATAKYTPNKTKANGYAGLTQPGTLQLSQSGDGDPVYVVATSYPAPISSGYGQRRTYEQALKDLRNDARATGPDDSNPRWAGNRFYWNTEVVLNGVGAKLDPKVWDMMVVVGRVLCDLFEWSPYRHVGHLQHTGRKVDLWDGTDQNGVATMIRFRKDVDERTLDMAMNTETWAQTLRNPLDIDRMAEIGVITEAEANYWTGRSRAGGVPIPTNDPEWQDLRNAVEARSPFWV